MKVLFEDNENALLSKLFRRSYTDTSLFVYTEGSSSIYNKVLEFSNTERIFVYLDTIPGNSDLKKIYDNLKSLANSRGNMLIFPIVCSEYYFLRAFGDRNDHDINICVNKGNYFTTKTFALNSDCNNFEKFCKDLIRDNVRNCMSHDSRNKEYKAFYEMDCLCKFKDTSCKSLSLLEKSVMYLAEYDCVPSRSNGAIKTPITDLYKIHIKLVDEFNKFSDFLKTVDNRSGVRYKRIRPQNNVI